MLTMPIQQTQSKAYSEHCIHSRNIFTYQATQLTTLPSQLSQVTLLMLVDLAQSGNNDSYDESARVITESMQYTLTLTS